ncbi:MAG: M48 family metalloprotease [Polyangiaceae bacterium]|nr:M48 family metalloprotease [Myxococcales bacterium]MCB9587519.1 M48 family metalloprotease [Polyangiaceae bacterium]MCB9605684.1 M48 family metalloprotease [Polyangiaceae bacterium]
MSDAAFPLLGPVLVLGVVLPLSAVCARLLLWALRRIEARSATALTNVRYWILVGSSALPIVWFVSASIHQAEPNQPHAVCAIVHHAERWCAEPALFSLALSLVVALWALPRVLLERRMVARGQGPGARVTALIAGSPSLQDLRGRVHLSDVRGPALVTVGLLRPRVVLQRALLDQLDDPALVAALAHEASHVRRRDPLRYLLLWWALALNPLGRWLLGAERARWVFDRESRCDLEAVQGGACGAALAHALVLAARTPVSQSSAALGSGSLALIKLRIRLLLNYSGEHSSCATRELRLQRGFALGFCLLCVAIALLPHGSGTLPLDLVHEATEAAARLL